MTTPRRVRGIAAVLATLTAATLATTAEGDAHAATRTAGGGAAQAARTSLHIHVTGCDRCSVQLYQAIDGRPTVWHSAKQKIGSDHRVVFRVPTRRTHGMSFTLDAPWAKGLDHVPNMVTRYRGHAIDSAVKRQGARAGKHAEGCWAGTSTSGRVQLDFAVSRVRSQDGHRETCARSSGLRDPHDVQLEADGEDLQGDDRQPGRVLLPATRRRRR